MGARSARVILGDQSGITADLPLVLVLAEEYEYEYENEYESEEEAPEPNPWGGGSERLAADLTVRGGIFLPLYYSTNALRCLP